MTATDSLVPSRTRQALANSCQPQLRRLNVTETDDRVVVSGRVKSFYLKSLALETVKTADDGRRPMVLAIDVDD